MKAYVFPGQGSQSPGMGKDLYDANKDLFDQANSLLGFGLSEIMFEGTMEDLTKTKVTQPAVFLHSVAKALSLGSDFNPAMVAGHSLGEFSALVASGSLSFEDGIKLVYQRALGMQKACEAQSSTMAAIIGLDDVIVENICKKIAGIVVPANYNTPGQLVISGTTDSIEKACEACKEAGAKRAIILPVNGAFHSPLMSSAEEQLGDALDSVNFNVPRCPIYQNVVAIAVKEPDEIRANLKAQLTGSVKWNQTVKAMIKDGAKIFYEVGPGRALQGMVKKIAPELEAISA
jgi:[acyl-carrier-protein] S-malonyltransferase|tara:strand:- start:3999 stop:4865 length:867 start_codon:yes stop_codon:yes gene_type:complete